MGCELIVDDQDFTHDRLREGEVLGCVSTVSMALRGCTCLPCGRMRYIAVASPSFVAHAMPEGLTPANFARLPFIVFNRKDDMQAQWVSAAMSLREPRLKERYVPIQRGRGARGSDGLGRGRHSRTARAGRISTPGRWSRSGPRSRSTSRSTGTSGSSARARAAECRRAGLMDQIGRRDRGRPGACARLAVDPCGARAGGLRLPIDNVRAMLILRTPACAALVHAVRRRLRAPPAERPRLDHEHRRSRRAHAPPGGRVDQQPARREPTGAWLRLLGRRALSTVT
jgi:hypothetical protein